MPLKTLVKLSEVSNLSDARYGAGMGVQMMGFNIAPDSENYIDPEKFTEITSWIAGVELVGEFEGDIFSFNAGYQLDYIQISDPNMINDILGLKKRIILRINLDEVDVSVVEEMLSIHKKEVTYFLIEKSNDEIDKAKLKVWANAYPLIVGFAFDDESLQDFLTNYKVKGISIRGGEEHIVGFKDYDHLSAILDKLSIEE